MSGKGVSFRIDVILQSVNELREEKQALEQRYAEEKHRSKSLETKLEQETVKVAQQKVGQTDSQADRLNEINDAKQKVIADLNEKIKQETEKQENDVADFQLKLSELTQVFRDAKRAYAKDNLSSESKEWKGKMDFAMHEAETRNIELEDVTKAFENLSVDTNKIKELVSEKIGHKGVTCKELKAAVDHLTRKQEQLHKFLQWLELCESKAKSEIEERNKRRLTSEQGRRSKVVETEIADVIVRDVAPAQAYQKSQPVSDGQHGENHSTTDYSQPANNVDQGVRNDHVVPNQNSLAVDYAAPLRVSERVENVDVSNQNTAPVPRPTQGHIAAVNSPFFISLPFGRTR